MTYQLNTLVGNAFASALDSFRGAYGRADFSWKGTSYHVTISTYDQGDNAMLPEGIGNDAAQGDLRIIEFSMSEFVPGVYPTEGDLGTLTEKGSEHQYQILRAIAPKVAGVAHTIRCLIYRSALPDSSTVAQPGEPNAGSRKVLLPPASAS